jgi:hypothetical protein
MSEEAEETECQDTTVEVTDRDSQQTRTELNIAAIMETAITIAIRTEVETFAAEVEAGMVAEVV